MPPRTGKKAAAKRRTPTAKSVVPAAATPLPESSPIAVEDEKTDPEADIPPAATMEQISEAPESTEKPELGPEEEIVAVEKLQEPLMDASQPEASGTEASDTEDLGEGLVRIGNEENGDGEMENIMKATTDYSGNVEGDVGVCDDNSASDADEDNDENEEDDPAIYMQTPLTERKKQKEFEIFVGRLDKGAAEDDLVKVFSVFGEVQSVRIAKNPLTKKSKGFAFIRYASIEHAKKALAELKDETEVKGKRVRISASQDNDTLYLGNICKTWTKDHVIETLKGYGVEHIEDILLPVDPKNEGLLKGFGYLEFNSHSDAMAAFQRLRKPDAVFGCHRSARVAFTQTSMHPNEEALSQVKTVYVDGIPSAWDEEKIKELCKQYGEIEKIQLSQNFTTTKRKDFGFVEFTSRESALACVEGINSMQPAEGDIKVKADLAKPLLKSRLAKRGARGGFKVNKMGEPTEEAPKSKKKIKAKSEEVRHANKVTLPNVKSSNETKQSKSQGKDTQGNSNPRKEQSVKGKKRGRRGMENMTNAQPSKKARKNHKDGKSRGRPSNGFGQQRNTYAAKPYVVHQTAYIPTYAPTHTPRYAPAYTPRYAPAATRYGNHGYAGSSSSQHRRSDLEPHAGYLPPAKQVLNPYEYEPRRSIAYDSQLRSSAGYGAAASMTHTSYPGYSTHAGYEAYPGTGAYPPPGAYY